MIIHLVRHGLPKIGSDGLYLPNAGLTELGHRQASLAAGRVVRLKPDTSFTSDMPRAIESAAHFEQATNQNVSQIPNLAELLHIASTSGLNRIAAFLHKGVIGTIIDHLEGRNVFDTKRRAPMPYGALITVDTESNAPHFPCYWETDHLDELTS